MKKNDLERKYMEYQAVKMSQGEAASLILVIVFLGLFGAATVRARRMAALVDKKTEKSDSIRPTDAMIRNHGSKVR